MIHSHPLGEVSDFSNQNIVDASYGYDGDWDEQYEGSGDFGLLGNEYGLGDEGLGKSWRKRFKKITRKIAPKAIAKVAAKTISAPSKLIKKSPINVIAKKTGISALIKKSPLHKLEQKVAAPIKGLIQQKILGSKTSQSVEVEESEAPAQEIIATPAQSQSVVVSQGKPLTSQSLSQSLPKSRSIVESPHPLLAYGTASSLGYYDGMGLSFSDLLASAKKKASEELKKLQAKATADLKARAGQALSNVSGSILAKPEVQGVLKEQAQVAATNTLAEKLRDPETQKKIMIGAAVGAGILGLLAYKAFNK